MCLTRNLDNLTLNVGVSYALDNRCNWAASEAADNRSVNNGVVSLTDNSITYGDDHISFNFEVFKLQMIKIYLKYWKDIADIQL